MGYFFHGKVVVFHTPHQGLNPLGEFFAPYGFFFPCKFIRLAYMSRTLSKRFMGLGVGPQHI